MNGYNFKNETLFLSFGAIIATRNRWDGTNFHIRNFLLTLACLVCWTSSEIANDLPTYKFHYTFLLSFSFASEFVYFLMRYMIISHRFLKQKIRQNMENTTGYGKYDTGYFLVKHSHIYINKSSVGFLLILRFFLTKGFGSRPTFYISICISRLPACVAHNVYYNTSTPQMLAW